MSRTRFAAVAVLSAASLLAASRGAAQTVVVGPGSSSVAALPGKQFSVPVVADMTNAGGASLGSITARLLWRPATARFIGTAPGTFGAPVVNADTVNGVIKFAVANPAGATGTSVLLNALFVATDTVAGDTMSFQVGLDEVTRAQTFTDLLPISVTTGAMMCVSGGKWGDLNADTLVSAFDAAIVVTNAVGLPIAPYSVRNGDVDGDGKVTTRDALGILTYVVGLPTPGFHIGVLNTGSCAVQGVASLALNPLALSLAAGDRLPLSAVVKDSAGVIVGAFPAIGWQSQDTTVARVDALGQVTAVAAGSTKVVAFLSPGIADTAAVTVSATRHVWYVNPAIAAGNTAELGSSTYPFSSIAPAITAAAAGDTIHVAPALYGELVHVTKSLLLLGDSNAAGIPRLKNSTGPAIVVDTVSADIRRFQIEDSQGGIVAQSHSPRLAIADVTVLRSTAPGVIAIGAESLLVNGATIAGAVDMGLIAESVMVASIHNVSVDLVASSGGGKRPGAIGAVLSDSVDLLGVTAQTADLQLNGNRANSLRNVMVKGVAGPGLEMNGGTNAVIVGLDVSGAQMMNPFPSATDFWSHAVAINLIGNLRLDSSAIHDNMQMALLVTGPVLTTSRGLAVAHNGGGLQYPTALLTGVGDVRLAQANFVGNAAAAFGVATGGNVVIDTSTFAATNVAMHGLTSLAVHGGLVSGGSDVALLAYSVTDVTLFGTEVTGTQVSGVGVSPVATAVQVQYADSVQADSLWLHGNQAGALDIENTRAFAVRGITAEQNWLSLPGSITIVGIIGGGTLGSAPAQSGPAASSGNSGYAPSVRFGYVTTGRVSQSVIDDRTGYASVGVDVYLTTSPASVIVDSVSFVGPYTAVNGYSAAGATNPDTLIVRGSSVAPGGVTAGTGVTAYGFHSLQVLGNAMDSLAGFAVYSNYTGAGIVQGNTLTHLAGGGVFLNSANYGDSLSVAANAITCVGTAVSQGIVGYYAPFTATNNTVTGCANAINGYDSFYGPYPAVVRGNTITTSVTQATTGIALNGYYAGPVVTLNDVSAGAFSDAIFVTAAPGYSNYPIDTLHLDSNTVHDFTGRGIHVAGTVHSAALRGNLVTRYDTANGALEGVLLEHSGGARLVDNKVSATAANGMRIEAAGDTVFLDSLVVVDDSGTALTVGTQGAINITGSYNFFSRNGAGLYGVLGTLYISNSVFQGNRAFGVYGPISYTVNGDWWGDTLGPARPGNGSLGDSVIGANADTYLKAPPAGAPSGAPRAFLAARSRLVSGATVSRALPAANVMRAGATRAVRPVNLAARRGVPPESAALRANVRRTQLDGVRSARERAAR